MGYFYRKLYYLLHINYLLISILFFNFFKKIFLMWTILKVFIEFVTILLLFYVLVVWLCSMWDLSSLTRDWTCTPCIGMQSPNHWTTREAPTNLNFRRHLCFAFFSLGAGTAFCAKSMAQTSHLGLGTRVSLRELWKERYLEPTPASWISLSYTPYCYGFSCNLKQM